MFLTPYKNFLYYITHRYQIIDVLLKRMAKTTLIPLADRVIVTLQTEKKSLSGIIIPQTASKERPERGIVVAVGKGRMNEDNKRIAPEVSVGDEVVFSKYGPEEIMLDGTPYYILREDQILAIIK
jgi:chaperonin GroES